MEQLTPNNMYLLKWKTLKPNGQISNMIVLRGQFIKYFNNEYCQEIKSYNNDDDNNTIQPEWIGTVFTEEGEYIRYPFDDPLYPYGDPKQSFNNNCNFGLFRIISIENSIFKGIKRPFPNNNPYNFIRLNVNTFIDTPQIIFNETLMWVDLDKVEIKPFINKTKFLQEKAADTFLTSLPESIVNTEIKEYFGGTQKNNRKNKRKKTKKRTISKKRKILKKD